MMVSDPNDDVSSAFTREELLLLMFLGKDEADALERSVLERQNASLSVTVN